MTEPNRPLRPSDAELAVEEALALLPTGDRDVLLLRYYEERSVGEIGRRLGISEDAASKRINRALERLHKQFPRSTGGLLATEAALAGVLGAVSASVLPEVAGAATLSVEQVTGVALGKIAASSAVDLISKGTLSMLIGTTTKTASLILAAVLGVGGVAGFVAWIASPLGNPIASTTTLALAAEPAPATKPKSPEFAVTQTRVEQVSEFKFVYASEPVTGMKIEPALDAAMQQFYPHYATLGPYIRGTVLMISDGFKDPGQPFDLQVGHPVSAESPEPPEGLKLRDVPAARVASVIFTGHVKHLGRAYEQIYSDIGRMGLSPTGEWRQLNLYRDEAVDSSNVMLIQVEVK